MKQNLIHELVMGKKQRPIKKKNIYSLPKMNFMGGLIPKSKVAAAPIIRTKPYYVLNKDLLGMKTKKMPMKKTKNISNSILFGVTRSNPMKDVSRANILGDRKSKMQTNYLKRHKGIERFYDTDKDGVINGLDCNWKDASKHGIVDRFKNAFAGRGFRNDETVAREDLEMQRQQEAEAQRKLQEREMMYRQKEKEINDELMKEKEKQREIEEKKLMYDQAQQESEEEIAKARKKLAEAHDLSYDADEAIQKKYKKLANQSNRFFGDQIRYQIRETGKVDRDEIVKENLLASKWRNKNERKEHLEVAKAFKIKFDEANETIQKEKELKEQIEQQKKMDLKRYKEQMKRMGAEIEKEKQQVEQKKKMELPKFKNEFKSAEQKRKEIEGRLKNIEENKGFPKKLQRTYDSAENAAKLAKERVSQAAREWGGAVKDTASVVKEHTWPGQAISKYGKKYGMAMGGKEKKEREIDVTGRFGNEEKQGGSNLKRNLADILIKQGFSKPELTRVPKLNKKGNPVYDEEGNLQYENKQTEKVSFTRPISRFINYALENPENREILREEDLEKEQQSAIVRGLIPKKKIDELKKLRNDNDITDIQYKQLLNKLARDKEREDEIKREKERLERAKRNVWFSSRPIQREFDKQLFLDARRKQEISKVNIERAKYELENLERAKQGRGQSQGGLSVFLVGARNEPVDMQRSGDTYMPRYTFPEQQSGYFDPNAPKFVYRKDIGSFTRKTNRVGGNEFLILNEESQPSSKKREGSMFPWTKPMKNWKRVYVGRGRQISKGRQPKSRSKMIRNSYKNKYKVPKLGFQPHPNTYGHEMYKRIR